MAGNDPLSEAIAAANAVTAGGDSAGEGGFVGNGDASSSSLAGLLNKPTLTSTSPKELAKFIDDYDLYKGNLPEGAALSIKTCIGARVWRAIERVALAREFIVEQDVDLPAGLDENEIRKLLEQCATSMTGQASLAKVQRLKVFDVTLTEAKIDQLLESYEMALRDAREQALPWKEIFPSFRRAVFQNDEYMQDAFKAKTEELTSVKKITSFLYRKYLEYRKSVEIVRLMTPSMSGSSGAKTEDKKHQRPKLTGGSTPSKPKSYDKKTAPSKSESKFTCWGCGQAGHRVTECPTFMVDNEGSIVAKQGNKEPLKKRLFKKEAGGAGVNPTAEMPTFPAKVNGESNSSLFYLDSGSAVSVLAAEVFDRVSALGKAREDTKRYLMQLDGSVFEAEKSIIVPLRIQSNGQGDKEVELPQVRFYRSPGKLSFLGWPDMVEADLVQWLVDESATVPHNKSFKDEETKEKSTSVTGESIDETVTFETGASAIEGASAMGAEPLAVPLPPADAPFDFNDSSMPLDGDPEDWCPPHIGHDPEGLIRKLVEKYKHLFPTSLPKECAKVEPVKFNIKPGAALPKASKPRPLSRHKREAVKAITDKMLKEGIIEKSDSPHASPIVLAVKPGREGLARWRLCIDYRAWNDVFEDDPHPVGNIQEMLEETGGGSLFASLDLKSAYYQMPIHEDTKRQLAFCTTSGLFEWKRLPMGPKGSPARFVKEMNAILIYSWLKKYFDDLAVFASGYHDLVEKLEILFKVCTKYNLVFEGTKCHLGVESISFLGHIISKDGVAIDPNRIDTILAFPAPNTKKQVRRFLGMVGFCRRHVANMSEIVAPLTNLTKKDVKFEWSEACQTAFDEMKKVLTEAPVLRHFDPKLSTMIRADASNLGTGGVLLQEENREWRPVAYCSHKFNSAELNYSTIEMECYAIVHAVKSFNNFVEGLHFVIESDHKNLVFLTNCSTPRVQRWRALLLGYRYIIRHVKGSDNTIADALSRMHESATTNQKDDRDPSLIAVQLAGMTHQDCPANVEDIISQVHNFVVGHHGINGCKQLLQSMGHTWRNMDKDIADFIRKCDCQILNDRHGEVDLPMRSTEATEVFATVALDLAVNLPKSIRGNRHILVVICCFSRFIELIPIPRKDAITVAKALMSVIGRYGRMVEIRSDNGGEFINNVAEELCKLMDIKQDKRVPYRPASNGIVERAIQEVTKHVKSLIHELKVLKDEWEDALCMVQYIMNNKVHSATGFAPITLMFGQRITPHRHLLTPSPDNDQMDPAFMSHYVERMNKIQTTLVDKAAAHQQSVINKRMRRSRVTEYPFKKGDYVLLKPNIKRGKLQSKLLGPYQVEEANDSQVRLKSLVGRPSKEAHPAFLRPYVGSDPVAAAERNDEEIFTIEKILSAGPKNHVTFDSAKSADDFFYRVKFEGYDEPEWHTYDVVQDSPEFDVFVRSLENAPKALVNALEEE